MKAQRKPKFKVYGINSDVDTCSECGKSNLKKVVWLMPLDSEGNELAAEPAPVGCDCAARMMGWSYSRQKTERQLNAMLQETKKSVVNARIRSIFYDMVIMGHTYLPIELAQAAASGKMTKAEAFEKRNQMYPILEYNNGTLSLDDAYVMASS